MILWQTPQIPQHRLCTGEIGTRISICWVINLKWSSNCFTMKQSIWVFLNNKSTYIFSQRMSFQGEKQSNYLQQTTSGRHDMWDGISNVHDKIIPTISDSKHLDSLISFVNFSSFHSAAVLPVGDYQLITHCLVFRSDRPTQFHVFQLAFFGRQIALFCGQAAPFSRQVASFRLQTALSCRRPPAPTFLLGLLVSSSIGQCHSPS